MTKVKRNYRDSLFRSIFKNKKNLLSLYNALEGTTLTNEQEIKMTTLKGTFFNDLKNDISFKIGDKYIVLLEHQSTVNENMPIRCLFYIAKLYQRLVDDRMVYRERVLKLPAPKFYVFYNGGKNEADVREMRLSDAFAVSVDSMELVVKAYNINYSEHREILNKCRVLREYSVFVGKIKEGLEQGVELGTAVKNAIRYCIDNDIMKDYLLRKQEEVSDMVSVEWDIEKAKRNWYEEGIEQGIIKTAMEMIKNNFDVTTIANITKLSAEKVRELAKEQNKR